MQHAFGDHLARAIGGFAAGRLQIGQFLAFLVAAEFGSIADMKEIAWHFRPFGPFVLKING